MTYELGALSYRAWLTVAEKGAGDVEVAGYNIRGNARVVEYRIFHARGTFSS